MHTHACINAHIRPTLFTGNYKVNTQLRSSIALQCSRRLKHTHKHTHAHTHYPLIALHSNSLALIFTHTVPLAHPSIQTPHGVNLPHSCHPLSPLPPSPCAFMHINTHTCPHIHSRARSETKFISVTSFSLFLLFSCPQRLAH